jgi:hypothetical protein
LPNKDRVDVRFTLVSEKTALIVDVLTVDMAKLGALSVLTVTVEKFPVVALIVLVDIWDEDMAAVFRMGVDIKRDAVKEVAVVAVVEITFITDNELTCNEEILTEFLGAKIRLPPSPVMYACAPELADVVWSP